MPMEKVTFTNDEGHTLAGRLECPDGETAHVALFAHCFTCTKNLAAVGHICRAMTSQGIAVLRFDFTGLGDSDGDFADTNFSSNVNDLLAAAAHLREHVRPVTLLIGHSLGGAAVLQAAARLPEVKAVATIGAPAKPQHVRHLLTEKEEEIVARGSAEVRLAGRPFRIKKQFLDDLTQHDQLAEIANLRKALLICHAPLDDTVGVDNAADIFQAAKHPKSFLSLADADHLLTNREDARYAGSVIASWASRYLNEGNRG